MSKIGNYVVGGQEDGHLTYNEDEHCYEEIEHPFVDEEKERRAGFFDDDQGKVILNFNKGEDDG